MFIGKYYLHADDKGRLRIPLKFRYNMGTAGIYAMYTADGCLSIITAETASNMIEKFEGMGLSRKKQMTSNITTTKMNMGILLI